jgi:hypothetical protein
MERTIQHYELRIEKLTNKSAEVNRNLINKARRRLRAKQNG